MKHLLFIWIVGILTLATVAQEDLQPRSYRLGFTPFPYDLTMEAVNFVYDHLAEDADLVLHHFDNGIPWQEALEDAPFPDALMEDWRARKAFTPENTPILLSVTPISITRDSLALYRAEQEDMPLPPPWDGYRFNHPDVKEAFYNYVRRAIDFFDPAYVVMGIEANLLLTNAPQLWEDYVELHQETYTRLKADYPDLPLMVSVVGTAYFEAYSPEYDEAAQRQAWQEQLYDYTDYFAVSWYPYMSALMTNDVPETVYDELFALAGDKPIAIAESGFPAEDLVLAGLGITMPSSVEQQASYMADLLAQADEHEFVFLVNFVLRDYDALFQYIEDNDLNRIWRDTGLYDETGQARPALALWKEALSRPYNGDS